ncbi:hypothetical protein HY469_02220 [Candidatus Roizmanbacteria bacterium]|nr:hypothetical protein [Candidatus Roizmanbacteria bacterium]
MKDLVAIRAILLDGMRTEFWRVICDSLDENIDLIEKDMDDSALREFPGNEYKIRMEVLKAKKRHLIALKEFPGNVAKQLEETEKAQVELDPYRTSKDFLYNEK